MSNKIYIKDWLTLKPYTKQARTDLFYLKLANQVNEVLIKRKVDILKYISNDEINTLACFITSYLEDIVSYTEIWNTFIGLHHKLYDKYLPFYNLDDYIENEVNEQDISFLIWYFCNTIQNNKFISPFNEFITESAKAIFVILDNAWEQAPENSTLSQYYTIDSNEADFYEARSVIDALLFSSYLFYPDTAMQLQRDQKNILLTHAAESYETKSTWLNESRDTLVHKSHTRLLATTGSKWAAKVVNVEPIAKYYAEQSQKIAGIFWYKGQDISNIRLEHIASGKKFKMTKKSFNDTSVFETIDTAFYLGIVKWNEEWWFSGMLFNFGDSKQIAEQEKHSDESLKAVSFLDEDHPQLRESLKLQYEAFLAFNGGSPIAFMRKDNMELFCKEYFKFFNKWLNLSKKEIEKIKKGNEGKELINAGSFNFDNFTDQGLVFFNSVSGIEMAFGINDAFAMDNNPYFDATGSEEAVTFLFTDNSISTELAYFAIEKGIEKLPFFKSDVGRLFLSEIDFLLRFWKKENYLSKPSISLN